MDAVIGALIAIVASLLTWRLTEQSTIRNEQRERLRGLYAALVASQLIIMDAARADNARATFEPPVPLDPSDYQRAKQAYKDSSHTNALLSLEEVAALHVSIVYTMFWNSYWWYHDLVTSQDIPEGTSLEAAWTEVTTFDRQIHRNISRHLGSLERQSPLLPRWLRTMSADQQASVRGTMIEGVSAVSACVVVVVGGLLLAGRPIPLATWLAPAAFIAGLYVRQGYDALRRRSTNTTTPK